MSRRGTGRRSAANPVRFSLELHTEGSLDSFPPLFGGDLRRDALISLLLGKATDIVQEKDGGLVLLSKDTDGFDNPPRVLGSTLLVAPMPSITIFSMSEASC